MDDLTHVLTAVITARQSRWAYSPSSAQQKNAALATCILAQLLPDLDTLLSGWSGGGNLGSMLQHRGYTHTLVAIPVLGALAGVLGGVLVRIGKTKRSAAQSGLRSPFFRLWGLGCLSATVHLLLDSLNDYGVHPLWPFHSRWWALDSVFIFEPLLWLSLLFALGLPRRWLVVVSVVCACVLMLAPYWPAIVAGPFFAFALVLFAFSGSVQPARRITWGLALALVWVAVFWGCSSRARALVMQQFERAEFTSLQVIQSAASPLPANPLCWRVSVLQKTSDQKLHVSVASVSLLPRLLSPSECRMQKVQDPPELLLAQPEAFSHGEVFLRGAYSALEFRDASARYCAFSAFLRFARIPYFRISPDGTLSAQDLRYGLPGPGHSHIQATPSQRCEFSLPAWEPPVHD